MIAASAPDVVVLDLGLPDRDGQDVLREARAFSKIPIIVLSARDREAEKIVALDSGADDYVEKPFGIGELMARLRAALRHAAQDGLEPTRIESGGLCIDFAKRSVTKNGVAAKLTPKEYDLLTRLAPSRTSIDASTNSHRGVGAGAPKRYAVPAGVRRPVARQDRGRPFGAALHSDGTWRRLSLRRHRPE
jgi:hypothetical protein